MSRIEELLKIQSQGLDVSGVPTETQQVAQQILNQKYRVEGLGGKLPEERPGGRSIFERGMNVVGRTFDVLSRGQYAVAEAVESAIEGENPAQVIGGALSGLAGRSKTSFSDVLETAGVDNKWIKGIGGFALDVALDPTTYIGAGVVKQVSEEALGTLAGKVARSAVKSSKAGSLAKKAVTLAKLEANKTGEVLSKKVRREIEEQTRKDFGVERALEYKDKYLAGKIQKRNPLSGQLEKGFVEPGGFVQLKFAGKPITGSNVVSRALYGSTKHVARRANEIQIINAANRLFRPKAIVAGRTPAGRDVNQIWRETQGAGILKYEQDISTKVDPAFKGLTKSEKRRIAHAIEKGVDFGEEVSEKGVHLQTAKEEAQKLLNEIASLEQEIGFETGKSLLDPKRRISNYVYHVFRGGDKSQINSWKAARRKETVKLNNSKDILQEIQKQFPNMSVGQVKLMAVTSPLITVSSKSGHTLERAIQEGLNPVEEIDEIINLRWADSYRKQARYMFSHMMNNEFGVAGITDDVAKKLGLVKSNNGFIGNKSSYIPGKTHLPKEIDNTLKRMSEFFNDDDQVQEFLRYFDKAQNSWKFAATVVNPAHHIRNMMGDTSLNWLDGVKNPARYEQSSRIVYADRYKALGIKPLTDIRIGEIDLPVEKLMNYYTDKGAKAGFFRTEFNRSRFKVTKAIRGEAEKREDFTRMAHFIDVMIKQGKGLKDDKNLFINLDKIATEAGARVRKYNIDYGDLTPFEQKFMKRIVPFYTFIRKNLPLQIESMFLNPGRMAAYPKGLKAIEQLLGAEGEGPTIEGLSTLPLWMRQGMLVNLVGEGVGRNGIYWDPGVIPVFDLNRITESEEGGAKGILQNLLSMTTPALQMPFEAASGVNLFTGTQSPGIAQQLLSSVPLARTISRGTGGGFPMTSAGGLLSQTLVPGLRQLTPQQQTGELRRQQDYYDVTLRNLREQARTRALQQLYGNNIPPQAFA